MTQKASRVLRSLGIIVVLALPALLIPPGPNPVLGNEPGREQPTASSAAPRGPAAASEGRWVWQNPLPTGNTLRSVAFVDASTGWAVGRNGTILKTASAGASWLIQSSPTAKYTVS